MKKTVIIEEITNIGRDREFRVVRVKNAINPRVGEVICANAVNDLIADQVEVIIDLPRFRTNGLTSL